METVKNRPRNGKLKSVTNNNKNLDVLQSFQENPHLSLSRTAYDISQGSVFNILKRQKYHFFKLLLLENLWKMILIEKFNFVKK